jgi:hypothetical protein
VYIQAVVGFVQEAMAYIDQIKDLDAKIELISTLNTVTAGKVSLCKTAIVSILVFR